MSAFPFSKISGLQQDTLRGAMFVFEVNVVTQAIAQETLLISTSTSTRRKYNGKNLPVRVYTTKGLKAQGLFALENCHQIVDYFSDVFKIDYPLPKVDLLAVHEFSVCLSSGTLPRRIADSSARCDGELGSHHI